MYAKIVADSINRYNDRLTTYFVLVPYISLVNFYMFKDINISFKLIKHKKFKPVFDKDTINEYRWNSGIDLINSVKSKNNIVDLALTYASCIMTSTKWSLFFKMIYDSGLVLPHNQPDEFVDLIEDIENKYLDNVKNINKLGENEWHVSNTVKNIVEKIVNNNKSLSYNQTLIQYQYYAYHQMNTALSGNIDYDSAKRLFATTFSYSNANIYNHIAKVPIEYDYLTNGYFDSKWDSKLKKMTTSYNTMYDSYLCLYDIISEKRQKLDFN